MAPGHHHHHHGHAHIDVSFHGRHHHHHHHGPGVGALFGAAAVGMAAGAVVASSSTRYAPPPSTQTVVVVEQRAPPPPPPQVIYSTAPHTYPPPSVAVVSHAPPPSVAVYPGSGPQPVYTAYAPPTPVPTVINPGYSPYPPPTPYTPTPYASTAYPPPPTSYTPTSYTPTPYTPTPTPTHYTCPTVTVVHSGPCRATSLGKKWNHGNVITLTNLSSRYNLRISPHGLVEGNGAGGVWAQFQVERTGLDRVKLRNIGHGGSYLRCSNPNFLDSGPGGPYCEFYVVKHGKSHGRPMYSLESVTNPGSYVGIYENGTVKPPHCVGLGPHGSFFIDVVQWA